MYPVWQVPYLNCDGCNGLDYRAFLNLLLFAETASSFYLDLHIKVGFLYDFTFTLE